MTTSTEDPTVQAEETAEETVLEESVAEPAPFLRIVADYPVDHRDSSMPMRVAVELNVADVDETDESRADLSEIPSAGFIRLVTDTVGAMRSGRSEPHVVVNYAGTKLDPETMGRLADRAAELSGYGQRPVRHGHVVATVFGRTVHAPGCDGRCGFGEPGGEPGAVLNDDVLAEPAAAGPAADRKGDV